MCTKVDAWCIAPELCWFKVYHTKSVPKLVHGAFWYIAHNCGDLKSTIQGVYHKLMHGALHQNCAGLKSTIQSLYQNWCMMHSGALYQNSADLKSTIQGVYQS